MVLAFKDGVELITSSGRMPAADRELPRPGHGMASAGNACRTPAGADLVARRQPSVQLDSGGVLGLVQVLNATLLGSSCRTSDSGPAFKW